jgi:RHS repeat-associated protein
MRNAPGVFAATLALAATAVAQRGVAPTSRSHFVAHPVPFEEARQATLEAKGRAPVARQSSSPTTPPEIVQLARALKNDPDLIYQYVHDNIQFSPLWGYLKGPVGTLLDGQGDAFDQCSLMVALLNQAAVFNSSISNVGYEIGELSLTNAQLQSWLGVDSDPNSIGGVMGSGGFPGTIDQFGDATIGHVWVQVSINGTAYVFDPAFKTQTWKPGIVANLPGIMGYTQEQFLADAGGTVTSTSIQGVNRTALRNDLATYANKLAAYVRANLPTGGVSDLIGGGTIVPTPISNGQTVRQAANPYQAGPPTASATIPSEYYASLSITLPGAAVQTFNSADIYGHRLSIFFNASFVPTLYLDGTAVVSGSAQAQGNPMPVVESTSLPFAAFADQSVTQYLSVETNANGGSAGYVVSTGWGQVGRGMVEKHRTLLTQAIASGAASNSELVLGETVAMLGYEWLAQCASQQQLADRLLGTATQYFYGGGVTGEAVGNGVASPYVDLPLNFINTPARINGSTSTSSQAAYLDSSGASSSFESTTLEQTQASIPGFTAASTVKLLDIGLQNNDTIFDINNGNTTATLNTYTNTIRPQLVPNYNGGDLATIDGYVNAGYRVIAPLHGTITIGDWQGVGFKTLYNGGFAYGEIISGGLGGGSRRLAGGFGATNDPPVFVVIYTNGSMQPGSNSPGSNGPGSYGVYVGDPIDHRKGSLQYQKNDLVVGPKSFPYGLTFSRIYDSGAQAIAGPLGNGWSHNFAITATVGSDGFAGMGQGSLLNAVSAIAALYVSSDLMQGQSLSGQANLRNFVLEAVVNHWFTDQLTQTVVNFGQGWNTSEFVEMADGSYSSPVGSADILDAPGGNFRYRTKTGATMSFNSAGQISSWTNAAGASVSFAYSGGLLSTVANSATSRKLTLTYSGNLISSVSDGTRTVSYSYTKGDLTTFTDALGQATTFAYDTSGTEDTAGHLTQVFYPSNPTNPFVTTSYDGLGKVSQQADANANVMQTFFAGARTETDDPIGNRHVWYNDPRSNVLMEVQDYGPAPHLNIPTQNTYDGQSNLLTMTKPEGNVMSYTYDALFNPLTSTQTAKPGSTLSPLVQTFTYVVPVASLPNFEEVHTSSDPEGNVTTNSYNAATGTLSSTAAPAVPKPGAAVSSPTSTFTYTPIGLRQTATDPEGRVTHSAYDPTFGDQITTVTLDSGRLNLAFSFTYDSAGDIATVTDADGHVTTNTYDNLRRLVEEDRAIAGVVTKYTYYPDGPIQTMARQVTPGTFETTTYGYTLEDQVSTVTDPLGNTVTTTYDADDRKQTVTAQVSATQNRQRTYTYDALSRLYQVSDTTTSSPGTVLETHAYSPNSDVAGFTDANGHRISYAYDGFDRLIQTTYADGSSEQYTYNPDGAPLQKTARSGQTIVYTYDALNRLASKTPAGETAGAVTYGYDYSGRLLQAADATSTTPYLLGYDTAGRPISYTDQQGRNTQVQYDGVGNRTRLQWPAGTNGANSYFVTYAYDALNRMTEVDANGSPSAPLAKYQWDALSRLTLTTHGDGTTDSYAQYDAGDNPLELTESFTGGSDVTFEYEWLKNHQRESSAVSNTAFQYTPATGTASYTADVDNGYTSVGTTNLTYDGNHNLTYDGFNTLIFDVENRMIQAQNALSGTSQYFYDPLGHRKQKVVGGVSTQFVLAADQEIADYSGTGAGTPQILTVRGVGGSPLASVMVSSGDVAYYHHDAHGSTVALTQSGTTGAAEVFNYNEYGVPAGGSGTSYLFAGYRYDAETGLYYVRARYYSPQLGRFLQTDPIGIRGGRNLYAYVNNDPINRTDRHGTIPDGPRVSSMGPFMVGGITVTSGIIQPINPTLPGGGGGYPPPGGGGGNPPPGGGGGGGGDTFTPSEELEEEGLSTAGEGTEVVVEAEEGGTLLETLLEIGAVVEEAAPVVIPIVLAPVGL